ncbi:hypothetical protein [Streptomyces acidicola]|uniref:Uncharacterized protein n=1 Tax=Streptomyces acidicola TaxID=2596892 RepID=A0A5N8WT97_9ACTN|nr:hypothetical protein [Streptomyces acidicola]MPY50332.1 hypothetical protein [Streptomyces acidicola]
MTAGTVTVFQGSRSRSRIGAVLVVLLGALLHLLACAHGPTPTATGRVDSPPAAAASPSCGQPSGTPHTAHTTHSEGEQQTGEGSGSELGCLDRDEPTVQPPRGIAPAAPAVQTEPAVEHAEPQPPSSSVRAGAPPYPGAVPSPAGQVRARLGVWRT